MKNKSRRKSNKSDLKDKILNEHRFRSEYERYSIWYQIVPVFSALLLAGSAVLSTRFYSEWLFVSTSYPEVYGFLLSSSLAMALAALIKHSAKLWYEESQYEDAAFLDKVDLFTLLAIGLFAWGAFADIKGGAMLPEVIIAENTLSPRVQEIDKELKKIEDQRLAVWEKYRWKGKLPTAITAAYKKYGHDVDGDKATLATLQTERAGLVKEKATLQGKFEKGEKEREERVKDSQTTLQGVALGLNTIVFLLSFWRARFGYRVRAEADGNGESGSRDNSSSGSSGSRDDESGSRDNSSGSASGSRDDESGSRDNSSGSTSGSRDSSITIDLGELNSVDDLLDAWLDAQKRKKADGES